MFTHSDLRNRGQWSKTLNPMGTFGGSRVKRTGSPQPAVRSILKNATNGNSSLAMKNGLLGHSVAVDPFSKLCQLHTSGTGSVKVIGDESSMEYLLGIRAVSRDVFHEEIGTIAKAIYEEVSFRVSNGPVKERVVTISNPVASQPPDLSGIESFIQDSLANQKTELIAPITDKVNLNDKKMNTLEEKLQKLEESITSLTKTVQDQMQKESLTSEDKDEDIELIQSELETIKNEFAERGNLYIRLCEELESDRLDNKLMKEELEREFDTLDKTIRDQISTQISDNIDFFIENFKNDMKSLRGDLDQEREDIEAFMRKKIDDLRKRVDNDTQDLDSRLKKAMKENTSRYQNLVEKIEIETGDLSSKIKKIDNKLEAPKKFIGDKEYKSSFHNNPGQIKRYISSQVESKLLSPGAESPKANACHESSDIRHNSQSLHGPMRQFPSDTMRDEHEQSKSNTGELISNLKYEEIIDEVQKLRKDHEYISGEISTMKQSLESLFTQNDTLTDLSEGFYSLKSSTKKIQSSLDEKLSKYKLEISEVRKEDIKKFEEKSLAIQKEISKINDSITEFVSQEQQSKNESKVAGQCPEREFNMMFSVDPVKELEAKVYNDMEQIKQEISLAVKGYIDNRTKFLENPQAIISQIQDNFMNHVKTSFFLDIERSLVPLVQNEVKKEMTRMTIERESYEEEDIDTKSQSIIKTDTLLNGMNNAQDINDQVIVEEVSKDNTDMYTYTHGSDKENNDPSKSHSHLRDQDDQDDDSDVEDAVNTFSPPNKLPESFVESRGSILPSEASSSKKETINIFENS